MEWSWHYDHAGARFSDVPLPSSACDAEDGARVQVGRLQRYG